MPLDTLTNEQDLAPTPTTETQPATTAVAATRAKAKTSYDPSAHIATVHKPGATPTNYDIGALTDATKAILLGRGATHYLTSHAAGPDVAYKALVAGEYSGRKPAAPKPLDPKRKAIAAALVEHTKKSDAPMTQAAAEDKARDMTRAEVEVEMLTPIVVKHFSKAAAVKSALFG